jgi:hypothetical protein
MVVVATLRLVAFFITFASDGGGALIVSCAEITEQALVRKQSRATGLLQFQSKKKPGCCRKQSAEEAANFLPVSR